MPSNPKTITQSVPPAKPKGFVVIPQTLDPTTGPAAGTPGYPDATDSNALGKHPVTGKGK